MRPEPRPWSCIELSSFQEETGDVGQRPRRIIRAGDRNLGVIAAAWDETADSGGGSQGLSSAWPFVLVSIADLKSIRVANRIL